MLVCMIVCVLGWAHEWSSVYLDVYMETLETSAYFPHYVLYFASFILDEIV